MIQFRKAHADDFASCWQLIDDARWKMIRDGRKQWTPDYPSEAVVRQDIALGRAFLAVDTRTRGRGYGRRFIHEAERHALRQGVGSLKIDTNFDNTQMLSILQSTGYVACGEIDYGDKGPRLAFEKLLSVE